MLAASTPAAPLIAQNQGVGRVSSALTSFPCRWEKPNFHEESERRNHQDRRRGADHDWARFKKTPTKSGSQNGSAPR